LCLLALLALAGCGSGQSQALVLLEVQIAADVPPADHLALSVTDHTGVPMRTVGLGGGKQSQTIDVGYYMNVSGTVTVKGQALTASGCVLGEGTVAASAELGKISPAVMLMVSRAAGAAACATGSDGSTSDGPASDGSTSDRPTSDGATSDGGASDAGADAGSGSPPPPPRLIAPLSTATVTMAKPTLHWQLPPTGADGAHVQICQDRACTNQVAAFDAPGTSGTPASNLAPGVFFWRAFGRSNGVTGQVASPTWQFVVGKRSTLVDTSWGTTLDLNGDGYADVVVGAGGWNNSTGKVYVYVGGPTGATTSLTLLTSLAGPDGANGDFGDMVAPAGDVNGDGYSDFMVAGEGFSSGTGRVYVYLGGKTLSTPDITLTGQSGAHGNFGLAAAAVGDVNGDGYGDVVIGAKNFSNNVGIAYLYLGGPNGLPTAPSVPIMAPDGAASAFAISVAGAGDVNGDGYGDVVIGANNVGGGVGKAYLYLGGAAGLATTPSTTFTNPVMATASFGYAVAGGADVNGDGYADIVVTAPGANNAYTFHGAGGTGPAASATQLLTNPAGAGMGGFFGRAAADVGDVNGDGYGDVVITDDTYNNFQGRAYLYLGGTFGLGSASSPPIAGPDAADSFGAGVAGAGDIDRDGLADFIVGETGYNTNTGRAFVYVGAATVATTPAFTLTGPDGTNGFFGSSVALAEPPIIMLRILRVPRVPRELRRQLDYRW
jgi:hypothetical protein